eukprot:1261105-Rhodomonas_salina.2
MFVTDLLVGETAKELLLSLYYVADVTAARSRSVYDLREKAVVKEVSDFSHSYLVHASAILLRSSHTALARRTTF